MEKLYVNIRTKKVGRSLVGYIWKYRYIIGEMMRWVCAILWWREFFSGD